MSWQFIAWVSSRLLELSNHFPRESWELFHFLKLEQSIQIAEQNLSMQPQEKNLPLKLGLTNLNYNL